MMVSVSGTGYAAGVRRWIPLTVGALAVVIGTVWTLQGLGYMGGSAMTDQRIWAVIGVPLAVAGLVAVLFGLRTRRE
jgi:hypothetical protein